MSTSLKAVINLQMSRATFITETLAKSSGEASEEFGLAALESMLEMVTTYWEKFETAHEKLIASSGKVEGLLAQQYFKEKIFDKILASFSAAKIRIAQLMEKKGAPNLNQTRRGSHSATHSPQGSRRTLPDLALPTFSGVYAEWRSFRDLFSSMVIRNPNLDDVERMHYLRPCLSKEPAQIVSNLTISEDSFKIAWDLLVSRYENKRLLISAHLDQLLSPAPMASHHSKELNKLVNVVSESLSALKALDEPTDQWGSVVVHTIVQRLSPKIGEAWENKIGASTAFPQRNAY